MKKYGMLNSEISSVIANMGHTDLLAIGDCGLPIPTNTKKIDVALSPNMPSLEQVMGLVMNDLEVEEIFVAEETGKISPQILEKIEGITAGKKVTFIPQKDLIAKLSECKAVIRTGQQTYYSNVILKAGVTF